MEVQVGILNYGLGNLLSISRAFEKIGVSIKSITKPQEVDDCTHLVLPGVGAFLSGMQKLEQHGFLEIIKQWHNENKPLLGICLGMQMMLDESDEFGSHKGLGLITGKVKALSDFFPENSSHKIPHIGWSHLLNDNLLNDKKKYSKLCDFEDNFLGEEFYFVHSYACYTNNEKDTVACYEVNGVNVPAIIRTGNTIGVQFHPEKSRESGLKFLDSFVNLGND